MSDVELLAACKTGLNIPEASTVFDAVLTQKLLAVKSFMQGAGVSSALLDDPAAVGAIVIGVTDIYNLSGGEIKFSPLFFTLVTQLACRSLPSEGG